MASWSTISLAVLKTALDFHVSFAYNGDNKEQGTDVKSQDFRTFIIDQIRAFEAWAWKDGMENPEDWEKVISTKQWMDLFLDYIDGDVMQ